VSVRQRAVDLLYAMCDRGNVEEIVHEMLVYLEMADYSIREEMVSPGGDMFDVPLIYLTLKSRCCPGDQSTYQST